MELRDTYHGFGESMSRAFELAVTPALFGVVGYALDRWLGILPVLTITLALLAIVGLSLRMWCGYEVRMKQHDAEGPWARTPARMSERP